jgi:predicted nucleic-acid-binding protein
VFVPVIVLAELSWVLRAARWERERILKTIESLLQTRGVTTETPQVVQAAVDATRKGGRGGFADHLIAQVGFAKPPRGRHGRTFGKATRYAGPMTTRIPVSALAGTATRRRR